MPFITAMLTGLQYAPYLSQAIQNVEATNKSLPGATKKDIVLASIQAACKTGESVPETHVQIIATLIDIIVGIFNASGLFKQRTPAPAAVTVAAVTVEAVAVAV